MNGQNLEDASPVVWCELYAFSAVFRRAVIRTEKSRSCSKLIISHLGLQLGPSPSITHVSEGLKSLDGQTGRQEKSRIFQ